MSYLNSFTESKQQRHIFKRLHCISLQNYIAVKEKDARYLPHSAGRYAAKRSRKAQCPICECLSNSLMMKGRNNGKKLMSVHIVKHSFEIIHLLTSENPLQTLWTTRIGHAGTVSVIASHQPIDPAMSDLNQKTILVTGASQGIGNELCKHLAKLGAKVIAVSRNLKGLEALKADCPSIDIIQVDPSNWAETKKALTNVPALDGLVNNAGVAVIKPFAELTEEDFDCTFNVNIKAIFCVTQTVADKLKYGSSIVNISSLASSRSFEGHSAYGASKAAVDSLTKALALEFGPRKIRVNSVNPTVILTEMGIANWSDPRKSGPLINHIPLTRLGEVKDVIDSVVYLLSSQSGFVNGHELLLEGGYSVS